MDSGLCHVCGFVLALVFVLLMHVSKPWLWRGAKAIWGGVAMKVGT